MTLPSGLHVQLYRQLLKGPILEVSYRGSSYSAQPGDFLEAALVAEVSDEDRRRLGPAILRSKLEQRFRIQVEDAQPLVRPPGVVTSQQAQPQITGGSTQVQPFRVVRLTDPWTGLAPWREGSCPDSALLLDPDLDCPLGDAELGRLLAEDAARSGASVIFPALNLSAPCSLPTVGDDQSPDPRLARGRSRWELATMLSKSGLEPVPGRPANPGGALLTQSIAQALAAGRSPAPSQGHVSPRAWGWRQEDGPGPLSGLLGPSAGHSGGWPQAADAARRTCENHVPGRPPVCLYSTNVGPWGGVAVLLRLADELQALGLHAFVAHRSTTPHSFRPKTSPLRVPTKDALAADLPRLVGGQEAVIVASHWASGKTCRLLEARNPGTVLTTIVQDREDLFETPDRTPIHRSVYEDYLAIGRGRAVAGWIVDSLKSDLGLDVSGYGVIPPGLDLDVFKPKPRAQSGPIRILAMWRPQTEVRRGMKLLREVYERAHAEHGGKVSLELFGWDASEEASKAPAFARHHGVLSAEAVAALMGEVDIVVEPSLYQGFGLAGAEALACGAALVSTDCKGPREYCRHEENSLLVPHAELYQALNRLVLNSHLRVRFQAAGPVSVARLAWPRIGAEWALYLAGLYEHSGGRVWASEWAAVVERATEVLR